MKKTQALNLYRRENTPTGSPGVRVTCCPSFQARMRCGSELPKSGRAASTPCCRSIFRITCTVATNALYRSANWMGCFAFVRNPVSRMVSLHRNKVINTNDLGISEMERGELRDFNAFIEWIAAHDLTKCDGHWRLQTRLLNCERMDFIGRLESFDSDWNALVRQLDWGMTKPLVKKNRSQAQHDGVTADQIPAHRNLVSRRF